MILREEYLSKIKSTMWDGNIKVITGLRRSGKSTLPFGLFYEHLISSGVKEENIIYNELIRRGYKVDVGVVCDRRNSKNTQKEIDFVVNDLE